jgi:hypothetical protein
MAQTIKIERMGDNGMEIEEVTLQEAKKIVKEAYAQGRLVLDKQKGEITEEVRKDTKELLIIKMVAGG